jgi:hypothetical protein
VELQPFTLEAEAEAQTPELQLKPWVEMAAVETLLLVVEITELLEQPILAAVAVAVLKQPKLVIQAAAAL